MAGRIRTGLASDRQAVKGRSPGAAEMARRVADAGEQLR